MSALLYGLAATGAWAPRILDPSRTIAEPGAELGLVAAVSTFGGLALAMIRERALSIWPGVLLQFVGALLGMAALGYWLGG